MVGSLQMTNLIAQNPSKMRQSWYNQIQIYPVLHALFFYIK